jgi:hypothetical protein
MKVLLLAICLSGAIGAAAANAQTKTVNLRMKNAFDREVTIWVIDHTNSNKRDENNTAISPGSSGTSKVMSKPNGYVDFTLSVRGTFPDSPSKGYFCKHVSGAAGGSEMRYDLSKSSMKESGSC